MRRLLMVFALILAVATMMAPISAFAVATLYSETQNGGFTGWASAVGNVYTEEPVGQITPYGLPAGSVNAGNNYNLPGGEHFWFDQNMTYSSNYFYTTTGTSLSFALNPFTGISEFGFWVNPSTAGQFSLVAYMQGGGFHELGNSWFNTGDAKFYGWTDLPVYSVSIISYGTSNFGVGHLVEGGVAPIPEPSTLLLLGAGLVGLIGYGRKRMKK